MTTTDVLHYRDRPAAISVNVKSIADTSNFDDFPEIERNGESHDPRHCNDIIMM